MAVKVWARPVTLIPIIPTGRSKDYYPDSLRPLCNRQKMISALLHGKLSRQQENMEDILTSSVFGTLRYLPPEGGLFPFLRCTEMPDGGRLNALDFGVGANVEYAFWPKLHERVPGGSGEDRCIPCEPDVLLKIRPPAGRPICILIEAKFRSGKSSDAADNAVAPTDQLAREWDNLVALAYQEDAEPHLIYLTADVGIPVEEIQASEREYLAKRPAGAAFSCGWLSWRHLDRCIRTLNEQGVDNPCLRDLTRLCKRLDLRFYDGISKIMPEAFHWRFQTAPEVFNWLDRAAEDITWRFIP